MKERPQSGQVLRATFGCVPVSDDAQTRAYLNDLCHGLTERLGIVVRPHRAPTPASLASAFAHDRVQLAWVSPVLAAIDPGLASAVPIVHSVRFGMAKYRGVLFVRADSPIESIEGLRGARVAWVAPTSAAGYVFPRLAIAREDASILASFGGEQMLASHGAVVEAVEAKSADAGATFAVYEDDDVSKPLVRSGFGDGAFRVLSVSDPIPADVVVAAPALLDEVRMDLGLALEKLSEDPKSAAAMQHVLGAERFERCAVRELDALRMRLRGAA